MHVYVCIYIYVCISIHIYTCIHMPVYVCMHIYMYVYDICRYYVYVYLYDNRQQRAPLVLWIQALNRVREFSFAGSVVAGVSGLRK